MKAIMSVTREGIQYTDDNGDSNSIDLSLCNRNWVADVRNSGDEVDELDKKYVGWRDVCGKPPYIIFFTEPDLQNCVKLEFDYSQVCEVADERFWQVLQQLKEAGWRTLDLS